MGVLAIRRWPDPVLSRPCAPVGTATPEIRALAADMLETMYAAPGRGLAAPQVGVSRRLFVMDIGWKEGASAPLVCLDPEIAWRSAAMAPGAEGCLSIPGVTADITRPTEIVLRWRDQQDCLQEARLDGFAARCAQHEIDHLDGFVTFDRLEADARHPLEDAYRAGGA